MISFPFDNKSASEQDRNITSDIFADYLKRIVGTNGIFAELGTKGFVQAGEGMTVIVNPVDGFIEGRLFAEDKPRTLQIQASGELDRIDSVVARLDKAQRLIDLYVVKGTASSNPVAPKLTRTAGIYELGLANIFVAKLTTTIQQHRITDTRLDSERCGIVPIFGSVDTTTIYEQIQSDLKNFQTVNEADFTKWFEKIKGQLSTDAAGKLQLQIDDLPNNFPSFKTGTALQTGDDLNTFASVGSYKCVTYTIASSLLNCPTKQSFILDVFYSVRSSATEITQKITDFDGDEYIRNSLDGGKNWKPWRQTYKTGVDISVETFGGISIKQIWENKTPANDFAAQTLNIDTKGAKKLIIEYLPTKGGDTTENKIIDLGYKAYLRHFASMDKNKLIEARVRTVTFRNNSIIFGNGYGKSISQTDDVGLRNDYCVPLKIYVVSGIL